MCVTFAWITIQWALELRLTLPQWPWFYYLEEGRQIAIPAKELSPHFHLIAAAIFVSFGLFPIWISASLAQTGWRWFRNRPD